MCNSLISKPLGGGGRKLTPTLIDYRVTLYLQRKLKTDFPSLKSDDRQDITFVLVDKFGYEVKDLMRVFGISKSQAYRDIEAANFFEKRGGRRKRHMDEIFSYIIYNAKYIP
jgi:hypothetical protein